MSIPKINPILDHQDREKLAGTLFMVLHEGDESALLKALKDHRNVVDYYIQISEMEIK